jgi:hypothetical protein
MPCIEITQNRDLVNINNNCIFFYYWNDCGHCTTFKPIFQRVIDDLNINRQDFMRKTYIFKIEFGNFNLLPPEFKEVQAFPSVITYSNGKKIDEFKEQRTIDNLNKYILSSLGEPSRTYKPSTRASLPVQGSLQSSSSLRKRRVIRKYV